LRKTILEIYALAVCFVAVVCFVVALGMALYSLVGIANPEFTLDSWKYEQHQTNDTFFNGPHGRVSPDEKRVRPSAPELTRLRTESYAAAIAAERRENVQTLVKTLIVMAIDVLVFLGHWAIGRRARTESLGE
jgi:hypothetical protein